MTDMDLYQDAAQAYAAGVRRLFAPPDTPSDERVERGLPSPSFTDLADAAERLEVLSTDLNRAAIQKLTAQDTTQRMESEIQLLAKAMTELEISIHLYQAAQDEEAGIDRQAPDITERSIVASPVEPYLAIIQGTPSTERSIPRQGTALFQDRASARETLNQSAEDVLRLILERASKTVGSALDNVLGVDVVEVGQAIDMVGKSLIDILDQAEKRSRLYNAFRSFISNAYETLLALFGGMGRYQLIQESTQQALEWIDALKQGTLLSDVLENLYQTQQTKQDLQSIVEQSQVELAQFTTAIQSINRLNENYAQQIEQIDSIIQKLGLFEKISGFILPKSTLVITTLSLMLGTYVVLVGADCVDAPHLHMIERVPGVRSVVETSMQA